MKVLSIFCIETFFLSSIEDTSILQEGQESFQSSYSTNPEMFIVHQVECDPELFDELSKIAGTRKSAILLETAKSKPTKNRKNVYVQDGVLSELNYEFE